MASKYAKPMQVPEGFPEILRDFTREVLREQPTDVDEFAFQYFKAAIKARDEVQQQNNNNQEADQTVAAPAGPVAQASSTGTLSANPAK